MLRALLVVCGLMSGLAACVTVPPADAATAASGPRPVPTGIQRWTIAAELADCVGVAPMRCMRYRERSGSPWLFFYGPIEGFTFREGEEAEVEVRYVSVPHPPADVSSHRVILVRELSRRSVIVSSPPGSSADTLPGSSWQLSAMTGVQAQPAELAAIRLNVDDATRVSGHGGVNRFSAQADLQDSGLRIGTPLSTRMAGSPVAMSREAAFLSRLTRVATWRISDDQLLLFDQAGSELLRFRRAPATR